MIEKSLRDLRIIIKNNDSNKTENNKNGIYSLKLFHVIRSFPWRINSLTSALTTVFICIIYLLLYGDQTSQQFSSEYLAIVFLKESF